MGRCGRVLRGKIDASRLRCRFRDDPVELIGFNPDPASALRGDDGFYMHGWPQIEAMCAEGCRESVILRNFTHQRRVGIGTLFGAARGARGLAQHSQAGGTCQRKGMRPSWFCGPFRCFTRLQGRGAGQNLRAEYGYCVHGALR